MEEPPFCYCQSKILKFLKEIEKPKVIFHNKMLRGSCIEPENPN